MKCNSSIGKETFSQSGEEAKAKEQSVDLGWAAAPYGALANDSIYCNVCLAPYSASKNLNLKRTQKQEVQITKVFLLNNQGDDEQGAAFD